MTPEEKALLESTFHLAEKNNEILKSLRRSNRIGVAMRVVYWVLILVLSFGAYYLIQPYVEMLYGAYGTSMNTLNSAQDTASSFMDLLK